MRGDLSGSPQPCDTRCLQPPAEKPAPRNASAFGAEVEAPVLEDPCPLGSALGAPALVAPRVLAAAGAAAGALGQGAPATAGEREQELEAALWGCRRERRSPVRSAVGQESAAPAQKISPAAAPSGRAGSSARRGPSRPSPAPAELFAGREKILDPPRRRFRARGGAVEECGDNAPSVTAGPRRGRERRPGR